jgi:hypothetical protein
VELLFVLVIAAAIGGVVRYALPGRRTYGMLLVPGAAVVVTAIVWVALTWAGWRFDGGWIWVVALVAGGLGAIAVWLLAWRGRTAGDKRLLHALSGGRA